MSTRRDFVRQSALMLGALRAGHVFAQSATTGPTAPVAHTKYGDLAGETKAGVNIFRGVPFAQPPAGPLRFRPPQPLKPWTGVRDATRFAPASIQPGESSVLQSEDCLYLNVWAPRQSGSYPVFVWIHGGGFTGGRASDPLSDGSRFAENGIVCITVAYRLGVLGFLDMAPSLGPAYAGSGNNALRDLIAALLWVKENISTFGGDPNRVTVGGESAGAKLTDILLGTPSARPLFHQAISESGGAERVWPNDRALEIGRGFASAWTAKTAGPPSTIANAPTAQILEAQEQFSRDWPVHFPLRPEVDGQLIAQPPLAVIRAGASKGKRLLLGTNRDESALFIGPQPARDATAHDLGNLTLDQFRPIDAGYRKLFPHMPAPLRRIRSLTAEEYLIPSLRVADAHVTGGGEAFVYRLDFPGEGRFAGLAFHSYDLRFVWDHFGAEAPSEAAHALANSMHQAWVNFIQGKPPNAPGLPDWPAYTPAEQRTMILDAPSHVADKPEASELALWQGLLN